MDCHVDYHGGGYGVCCGASGGGLGGGAGDVWVGSGMSVWEVVGVKGNKGLRLIGVGIVVIVCSWSWCDMGSGSMGFEVFGGV